MVKDTKLYDTLDIPPTATENEINKAYYKLSKIWHPDKNAHRLEEATKKFQEMNEAKNILTNPEKREMYDKFGTTQEQGGPGGANFDPADLFGSMFGSMGGMPGMPGMPGFFNQQRRQQEDCVVEHVVGLDDLYNNRTVNIRYKHKVYCSKCNATGTKDGKSSECNGCSGKGQKVRVIRQGPMIQQMVGACDECNGSGENSKGNRENQCSDCLGNKNLLKETMFEFTLNKNMQNNQKILVNDKGHHFKNSKTNLIIIIKEQPHPIFKRQGNDLHMEIKLRLFQSLYGFTKMITHLDGRNIIIKHEKMIRNMKTLFKVKNEGIGNGPTPGHLYIHISTCMPKIDKLEEQENTILKKLLVKAHLAEYQKEQNINKNADKLEKSVIEELDDTDDENDDNDENHHQGGPGGPGGPGVQCVQQ
jgi:DnaJ family protein A protein 2